MVTVTISGVGVNCRVLLWAEKLGAGLWAGLLPRSWYCQLELEVTITDVVNLWQSPSLSDRIMWKIHNLSVQLQSWCESSSVWNVSVSWGLLNQMLTLTKEKCFGRPGPGRILTRGYIRASSNWQMNTPQAWVYLDPQKLDDGCGSRQFFGISQNYTKKYLIRVVLING